MGVDLIYGGARSGKTRYVMEKIKRHAEAGEKAVLLVPEHHSKTCEDLMLDWLGGSLSCVTEVLSFRRLAVRVLSETGGAGKPYADACGKSILMFKTLTMLQGKLPVLGRTHLTEGHVVHIVEAVSEFKRHGVSAQDLEQAAEQCAAGELLELKLRDLACVYKRFDEEVSRNYADRDDDLQRLLAALQQYDGLRDTYLYVDGFYGFTKMEYDLLELLFARVRHAAVCLPFEGPDCADELFAPVRKTYDRLRRRLQAGGLAFEREIRCAGASDNGKTSALLHLSRHLFRYPAEPFCGDAAEIQMHAAADAVAEAQDCAAQVLGLCCDRGARLRDMAVVVSDMAGYGLILSAVFRQCGIPCFLDNQEDILNHPLVVLCLCALECVRKNYTYETVFRYVKSGFMRAAAEDIDDFENYVLMRGIRWNDYKKEDKWQLDSESEPAYARVAQTRDVCVGPLLELEQKVRAARTARDYCMALYELLIAVRAYDTLQERIASLRQEGDLYRAAQYARIWNILMETLDQLVLALGDDALTLDQFCSILHGALSLYEIKIVPQTMDEVLITTKERLPNSRRDYLFFLGAADGLVPAPAGAEGILKDAERERLAAMGMELSGGAREKAYDEQFLLYQVLSVPEKGLYISYPAADSAGAPMRGSMLLRLIRNLFPTLALGVSPTAPEEYLPAKPVAFERLVRGLLPGIESGSIEQQAAFLRLLREDGRYGPLLDQVVRALRYQNTPERIGRQNVGRWCGDAAQLSVSQLERYASCRFSYYMEYMLRARERAEFKVSAVDLGVLVHCALEEFSRTLHARGIEFAALDEPTADAVLRELFASGVLQKGMELLSSSKRAEYTKRRLFLILRRCALLMGEQFRRSDFKPLGYELTFAENGTFPPIRLHIDGMEGDVVIRGKIDRADVCDDPEENRRYVRVVDYKSGSKALSVSDVYDGLSLQLLTYLGAAVRSLSRRDGVEVLPSGVLYFRIFDPIVPSDRRLEPDEAAALRRQEMRMTGLVLRDERVVRRMDREIENVSDIVPAALNKDGSVKASSSTPDEGQMKRLLAAAGDKAASLAKDMLGGDIAIDPYQKGTRTGCDFCPYRAVCAFDPDYNEFRRLDGRQGGQSTKGGDAAWQ